VQNYEASKFNSGIVVDFGLEDHNPPQFDMIRQFCIHAANWIGQDEDNVVVHCKAGMGRTGFILLHMHQQPTSDQALAFYARERTQNHKGVTIPSLHHLL
jgi:phosphatidylinositol-3,4,5-trisphosphate 3-phosphatase/dual-specificity protein phosphatase PTEN